MSGQDRAFYSITCSDKANKLDVAKTTGTIDLSDGYTAFITLQSQGGDYVLAYNKSTKKADVYQVGSGPALTLLTSTATDYPWDNLAPFPIAGEPHFIAYQASSGMFGFYAFDDDMNPQSIYAYSKDYGGDATTGFTTIELKSNFLGTVREGEILCETVPRHLGGSTHVWDSTVTDAAGRTISLFRCTQMILWPR